MTKNPLALGKAEAVTAAEIVEPKTNNNEPVYVCVYVCYVRVSSSSIAHRFAAEWLLAYCVQTNNIYEVYRTNLQ